MDKKRVQLIASFLLLFLVLIAIFTFTVNRKSKESQVAVENVTPSPLSSAETIENQPSPTKPEAKKPTPTPTRRPIRWGAYTGWQVSEVQDFENRVGRETNYLAAFVHWGNENQFPWSLANFAKEKNKTLVIFWEAMDYNSTSPDDSRFSYDSIIRGDWNGYLETFAGEAASYSKEMILVPFEEANSDWYPWSGNENGNTPEKHIIAYRRIRDIFKKAPMVKFGWTVNHESVPDTPSNAIEYYYPGNEYVDYIGVDGFNFGSPWQTFSQVFDPALEKLKKYQKPIIIFSMACAQGNKKAEWVADALTKQIPNRPEIVGWIWFNENKEKDWRVWSDQASLEAFKKSVAIESSGISLD